MFINSDATGSVDTRETLAENYCIDKLDGDIFPLTYQIIDKYQQKDKKSQVYWKYNQKLKYLNKGST